MAMIIAALVVVVYAALVLFALAWGIVSYILSSIGLQGVGKGLGLKNPWLAWIPYASVWNLGRIADKANELENGKKSNYATWVLIVMIVYLGAALLTLPLSFLMYLPPVAESEELLLIVALVVVAVSVLLLLIAIAYSVVLYICYYRVFKLCCPDKAVLFLVLSILLSLPLPFFVFYCRNKVPSFEHEQGADTAYDAIDY